jgi:hypothetical protein
MPKKLSPPRKNYYLTLACAREVWQKAQRLAKDQHTSVSTVLRQLVMQAPEPKERS